MNQRWQLHVDTGGTFTDALAVAPDGTWRRAKVLSSSALRGRVISAPAPDRLLVAASWRATADFLRGGRFRLLREGGRSVDVLSFEPATGELHLAGAALAARDADVAIAPGDPFEVRLAEEAPIVAARLLTGTEAGEALPPIDMRLGTTLATNALLTRSGAPTALFVTRGFGHLLVIGTQQRPDLFALDVRRPPPLHAAVVEVPARVAADGAVLEALDPDRLNDEIVRLRAEGVESVAVALMHADRFPDHERALGDHLRAAGFAHVSCSADLASTVRILPRAATAIVDAHLAPVVTAYLERIGATLDAARTGERDLPTGGRFHVMTSAGGLVGARAVRPKDMLLSGPAGGVVGAARAGRRAGFSRILSFDMGGTSTDVARCGERHGYVFEHRVGDAHLFAPALAIETVAAGGGSICRCGPNGLTVGPESAGAEPGPACYGAGGPLTLTDVNLLLGRLDPERFGIPVDAAPARYRLDEVCAALRNQTGEAVAPEAVLDGFRALADERMADAVDRISVRQGHDPADHALVAFGGAGGQHACSLGERLGVAAVVVPPDAGLLSAWGMAAAVIERFAARQVLRPLAEVAAQVAGWLEALTAEALARLADEGVVAERTRVRRRLAELRFVGQETTLQVEIPAATAEVAATAEAAEVAEVTEVAGMDENLERTLVDGFYRRYEHIYGHAPGARPLELVELRVVVSTREEKEGGDASPDPGEYERADNLDEQEATGRAGTGERAAEAATVRRAWFGAAWHDVPVHDRATLAPGSEINGPALVFEAHAATVVETGWRLVVHPAGALVMRRDARDTFAPTERPEAVRLEIFGARFEAIARAMGAALERTAVSTNVKERLDFSCAVLDAAGQLVVNAPHIPVHLGSLGLCVRAVVAAAAPGPGDVVVTNHPGFGGSHLPDLTVVAPVHADDGTLIAHVAARAHHAELGGIRPGSMPPDARCLADEGVVIPPTLIVAGGKEHFDVLRALLTAPPHPTRALDDNLADIRAAVAACHRGALALRELAVRHGSGTVTDIMEALERKAARRLRGALSALPDGTYAATERLDDGSPLAVRIDVTGDTATVDFTGSAPVHTGNLNATPAIVHSVLVYVLRLLVREELPLNDGLLEPVSVVLPPGLLNPPFPDDPRRAPSVVGGNVETSQRLVDTLLKALGLVAASQGTMNNVLFGDDSFSYYETVCGGSGAGDGFAGSSGVHTHMTNTRITDERFALRRGSGGAGRWRGGEGVVREMVFLDDLELSLLSQRRATGPYGLGGGSDGAPGRQWIVRADGAREDLAGIACGRVRAGDRLVLETPGGGGFGEATNAETDAEPDPETGAETDAEPDSEPDVKLNDDGTYGKDPA